MDDSRDVEAERLVSVDPPQCRVTASTILVAALVTATAAAAPLVLLPVAVIVTLVGAHRVGRRWQVGLVAWSLLLFHLGIVIGGLAGIPLATFGDATRTDEFMLYATPLPLLAMAVAAVLAPRTRPPLKMSIASLIIVAAPAWLVTQTVLAGLAALGVAGLMLPALGGRAGIDEIRNVATQPVSGH